jgi:hypothetical protein
VLALVCVHAFIVGGPPFVRGKPMWSYTSAKAHFEVCMKVFVPHCKTVCVALSCVSGRSQGVNPRS